MERQRTLAADTAPEAERVQIEIWRRMESWQKADLVRQLVRACYSLTLAGLRLRHPELSEDELDAAAKRVWAAAQRRPVAPDSVGRARHPPPSGRVEDACYSHVKAATSLTGRSGSN